MQSEYFIRERLDKLYAILADLWTEIKELEAAKSTDLFEYVELCEEYDFTMEKINLLKWVLGDE